jgi:hypothetical protein
MSTYKALVGKKIKSVSSDPSDSADGQMWYNTTTQSLRGLAITEAWASSGALIEANYGAGGAGSQTAMIYFGGSPYPARTNKTVEYNGTGWSTGGDYTGTVNYLSGCGTLTAGLGAGGFTGTANTTASAEYNGTSWTAGNSMSQQRMNTGSTMVGIQTAALITGGDQLPSTPRGLSACEEYDGTNWTAGGAYPVVIQNTAQAGTQTAGWAAGGQSDPSPGVSNIVRNATNHYDGSSWSAGGNLPGAQMRAGAAGTQTAGLFFGGGQTSNTNATFAYDGSTWSSKPNLATARQSLAAGGVSSTSTAAIGAGGYASGTVSSTEEFTASTNVITGAAWASGGNLNNARNNVAGCGTQTASLCAGGDSPAPVYDSFVEEYNGTSWSEVTNIPTNNRGAGMAGIQTAAVYFGGETHPQTPVNAALLYDGSSWTSTGTMPYNSNYAGVGGTGTQTAALGVGGYVKPPHTDAAIEFNGSTWSTNPNSYPTAVGGLGHCGTQTAALLIGGFQYPPAAQLQTSNTYDGSSFSSAPNLVYSHAVAASSGTQTDAIVGTGQTAPLPNDSNQAQGYDGTSWATRPNLSVTRRYAASGKSSAPASVAWVAGGYMVSPASNTNSTEEFTGETTAANVETFSTS